MPELPEVEMVRRGLEESIVGKTIATVEPLHPKPIQDSPELIDTLPGLTIAGVHRRAKLLYISFTVPDIFLAIHLKMTGQLLYKDAHSISGGGHTLNKTDLELPHKHTRVQITFTDGSKLFFNDLRLFGYLKLLNAKGLNAILQTYGIEPGLPNFTQQAFANIFKKRSTSVKALLLNQTVIAGLGNIYVDEACFYAKIRPTKLVHTLTKKQIELLYKGCKYVIEDSLQHGGTTFYSFAHTDGNAGTYLQKLAVFAKQGSACVRCGHTIVKIKHAGRGTHYCPRCQK